MFVLFTPGRCVRRFAHWLSRFFQSAPYGPVIQKGLMEVNRAFSEEGMLVVRYEVPERYLQHSVVEVVSGDSWKAKVRVPNGVSAGRSDFCLHAVFLTPGKETFGS